MDYKDRGMLKWQGFYLEEHSKKINSAKNHQEVYRKDEMTEEDVSLLLYKLWKNKKEGLIQLNERIDDRYIEKKITVEGFSEDEIFFIDNNQNSFSLPLQAIRSVEILRSIKWCKEGIPYD